jgi:hypothetical protein
VGEQLTINGTCFGAAQGSGKVVFLGGTDTDALSYASWTDTQIVLTVPAGATTGLLRVLVDDADVLTDIDSDDSGANVAILVAPSTITDIGQL